MATITIRVDEFTKQQIETLAKNRNQSVSILIRELIENEISPGDKSSSHFDITPKFLSVYQRLVLSLLFKIYSSLLSASNKQEDEQEISEKKSAILDHGYASEYYEVFIEQHPEMAHEDATFVMDVLDMFRAIKFSIEKLQEDKVDLNEDESYFLSFKGFDFNDPRESTMAGFARFLYENERWQEQKEVFESDHGNSHWPVYERYRGMLLEFNTIKEEKRKAQRGIYDLTLTPKDLKRINAAGRHS